MVTNVQVRVVVPVRAGVPAIGTAEAIAEAIDAAGGPAGVQVILIGEGTREAAGAVDDRGFADIPVRLAEIGEFSPARWTAVLGPELHGADLVVLPASANGRDLAPRLAAVLRWPLVAGAIAVSPRQVTVPRASGRALADVQLDGPFVATLQPGVRAAVRNGGDRSGEPDVIDVSAAADTHGVTVLEVLGPDAATMDLSEAPFILGAGAGLGTSRAVEDLAAVADALDASLGATRVVTDEGWVAHERQIGTTGVVVDPRVYVAFGVSGAVQHTSGLGNPDVVISVNTDAHCPMMEMADLAIVADAPAVVAELRRRLADGAPTAEEA